MEMAFFLLHLKLTINKTNGTFTDQQMMGMFNDYLGVDGVFAAGPLQGEPNGHIDMFMTMPQKRCDNRTD